MSYIHVTRSRGLGLNDYTLVSKVLGDERPAGQLGHWAGESEGSLCTVDVWESKADADRFAAERLFPAFEQAGIRPAPDALVFAYDSDCS